MKIIGITRFNVVTEKTLGSFRATRGKKLSEAKKAVFTEDNLKFRLLMLRNFCLKTYKMLIENDDNFYAIIIINNDLPEPFKSEVIKLCQFSNRVNILEIKSNQAVKELVREYVLENTEAYSEVFTFRYDDDDCLPYDYCEMVRNIAESLPNNNLISFNKGYALSRIDAETYGIRIRKYPLNAFGLGIKSNLDDFKSIFELGPHTKIDLPCHHDKDHIGYLCTIHATNDSRIGSNIGDLKSLDEILGIVNSKFPQIDTEALQSLSFRREPDKD